MIGIEFYVLRRITIIYFKFNKKIIIYSRLNIRKYNSNLSLNKQKGYRKTVIYLKKFIAYITKIGGASDFT